MIFKVPSKASHSMILYVDNKYNPRRIRRTLFFSSVMEPLSQVKSPFGPKYSVCLKKVWDPGPNSVAFDVWFLQVVHKKLRAALAWGEEKPRSFLCKVSWLQKKLHSTEIGLNGTVLLFYWTVITVIPMLLDLPWLFLCVCVCMLDPETAFKWEHIRRSLCCFSKRVCRVFAPEFPNTPPVWEKQCLSPASKYTDTYRNLCYLAIRETKYI